MLNVLVISNVSWDTRNSYGNTLSNWFEEWDDVKFYSLYCRSSVPLNSVCSDYYTVSPLSIFKFALCPSKIGKRINSKSTIFLDNEEKENKLINDAQQGRKEWMYLLSDLAYSSRIWINKSYKSFIKEVNPDIVFAFGIADPFIYENILYVKRNTKAKVVTFIADDVYGAYLKGTNFRSKLQARRFSNMIKLSDKLYGASEEMCVAYKELFGKEIIPLYKGCTIANTKHMTNHPIKIVYAGNLFWGRDEILSQVADALMQINNNETFATLEIYTGAFLTDDIKSKLNKGESSKIYGRRSYDEIVQILSNADLVLHVESFSEEQKQIVKYSFSTKIIDCLQSGSTMLTIGPSGISSVEYSRKIPGVIVIDDIECLSEKLEEIILNKSTLLTRAEQIISFAQQFHSVSEIRHNLKRDFLNLIHSEDEKSSNNRQR